MLQQILKNRERSALKAFYRVMNEKSKCLGLKRNVTNFAVAHGMHHDFNYSSARDMATISWHVMRTHSFFCTIIDTKVFECHSRCSSHIYKWENTNYMLWESSRCYHGIKTGITLTAGPCLAVNYKTKCGTFDFIVVVLNCKSRESRFEETPKLVEWACNKINKVKKTNYKPSLRRKLLKNLAHL